MIFKTFKTENGVTLLEKSIYLVFFTQFFPSSIMLIGSLFLFKTLVMQNIIIGIIIFLLMFLKGAYNTIKYFYLFIIQNNIVELFIDNEVNKIFIKYKSKLNTDYDLDIKFSDLNNIEEGIGSKYSILSKTTWANSITLHINKKLYIFTKSNKIDKKEYFELYNLLTEIVANNKKNIELELQKINNNLNPVKENIYKIKETTKETELEGQK